MFATFLQDKCTYLYTLQEKKNKSPQSVVQSRNRMGQSYIIPEWLQVCPTTRHGYTYAQSYKMSVTLAASLRTKLKLQNDDKVAVALPNIPEYPCTVLGVLQAGCIASMMNPAYTARK